MIFTMSVNTFEQALLTETQTAPATFPPSSRVIKELYII